MELRKYSPMPTISSSMFEDAFGGGPEAPDLSMYRGFRVTLEYRKWWLSLTDEEREQIEERKRRLARTFKEIFDVGNIVFPAVERILAKELENKP